MVLRWCTPKEAARLTGYSTLTIRRLARDGEIEAKKARSVSGNWRVRVELEQQSDNSGFLREADSE